MSQINIHKTKDDKVVHIQLNLPEKRNILTMEIILELTNLFSQLSHSPEAQVVILSGKGTNFCAGGDLRWLNLNPESSDWENIQEVTNLFKLFETIYSCPIPVIGKIHGSVFGGGLGLVSVCDIVAAQKSTKFCFSELKLSLIPSTIAPFVLKKISQSHAKELILSARIFSTEEALKIGLIHFSGNLKECENYMSDKIDCLLRYDKMALIQAKKLLNIIPNLSSEKAREYSIQSLAERRTSPEVLNRITHFLKNKK